MPKQTYKKLKSRKTTRLERQKLILQLVGEGVRMSDIARQLGISRQRVHQLARGYTGN